MGVFFLRGGGSFYPSNTLDRTLSTVIISVCVNQPTVVVVVVVNGFGTVIPNYTIP